MRAFDRWIVRGTFTSRDLGIFRILIAAVLLALPFRFRWIDRFPDSLFSPPPGPFRLLTSLPPDGWMGVLKVAVVIATLLMGIGLATRWSSILVSVLLIVGHGLSYSFGKIDHSILFLIAPAILSFSNWGASFSVDSLLGKTKPQINQWAVRLLAIAIGVSFATAAWAKIETGWLLPGSQIVKGFVLRRYFTVDDHNALSDVAASIHAPWAWEVLDWSVVALEITIALGFLSWRLLRVTLAVAALFHLAIHLLLGITFYWNVIVYGAFVAWGRLAKSRSRRLRAAAAAAAGTGLLALTVIAVAVLAGGMPNPLVRMNEVVLWAGTGIGLAYLSGCAVLLLRRRAGALRSRPAAEPEVPPAPMSRRTTIALRVAVAGILLTTPAALLAEDIEAEPYPALTQPAFNAPGPLRGDQVLWTRPIMVMTFADGSSDTTRPADLISMPVSSDIVFRANFYNEERANHPESKAWLKSLIDKAYAPREVDQVTVKWVQNRYDSQTGSLVTITIVRSTEIRY